MIISFLFNEVCRYSPVGNFIIGIYKIEFNVLISGLGQNFDVPDKTTNLYHLGGDRECVFSMD